MRTIHTLLLSSTLIAASGAAQAGDNFPYWYIGLNGQLAYVDTADVSIGGASTGETSFDSGWGAGISIGHRPYDDGSFLDHMRFELEATYRKSGFDELDVNGGGILSMDGDLDTQTYMFNTFFDIPTGSKWTPYLGAGLGIAQHDFQSNSVGVQDKSTVFAYQGMLGLYYEPDTMPDTQWGFGYRYLGSSDPSFTTITGTKLEHDFSAHNVELNARFLF